MHDWQLSSILVNCMGNAKELHLEFSRPGTPQRETKRIYLPNQCTPEQFIAHMANAFQENFGVTYQPAKKAGVFEDL